MVWLSEAMRHEELDRFIEIIHVDADHRVLSVTLRNVNIKAVFVLHSDVRGFYFADILLYMVLFESQLLEKLDRCVGIPRNNQRIECRDFYFVLLSVFCFYLLLANSSFISLNLFLPILAL